MAEREAYDSPWKDVLSLFFPDFVEFFFPEIAREIDWSRGHESLDKELRQIARDAEIGFRLADHLVRVWKRDGRETWVLVHAEVQAREEKRFGERMFVYYCRIRDLRDRPVASLAILADDNPNWRVRGYDRELWGCRVRFDFPTVKLLDFRERMDFLESSSNPFAAVVMAHLRTLETRKDEAGRLRHKLILSKSLYRRGWSRREIVELYRFIDWIMVLPRELEMSYHRELTRFEKEVRMRYVTTAERIGIEKGIGKGELIGEIMLAQRLSGKVRYSRDALKGMDEETLERIQREVLESLEVPSGDGSGR